MIIRKAVMSLTPVTRIESTNSEFSILSGFLLTTAYNVLRLLSEENASIYGE
jgi:hypothetical protein